MNIKYKQILYKQKKLLLMRVYTFCLATTSIIPGINSNEPTEIVTTTNKESIDFTTQVPTIVYKKCQTEQQASNNIELRFVDAKEKEENLYYDFPCPEELQDHIFKTSEKYKVPYEIMMTIIHRESGGKWDTNGVISSTNDYGLPQINICNGKYIEENLGYSMEDILYDPYKAIEAQAFLLRNIIKMYDYTDNIDYENVFGTYNGWTRWKEKSMSCEYASACMEIYKDKFLGNSRKLDYFY